MTPAEEDALAKEVIGVWMESRDKPDGLYRLAILAIRAAVAQERERCAKVCEEHEPKDYTTAGIMTRMICAAAIRRG